MKFILACIIVFSTLKFSGCSSSIESIFDSHRRISSLDTSESSEHKIGAAVVKDDDEQKSCTSDSLVSNKRLPGDLESQEVRTENVLLNEDKPIKSDEFVDTVRYALPSDPNDNSDVENSFPTSVTTEFQYFQGLHDTVGSARSETDVGGTTRNYDNVFEQILTKQDGMEENEDADKRCSERLGKEVDEIMKDCHETLRQTLTTNQDKMTEILHSEFKKLSTTNESGKDNHKERDDHEMETTEKERYINKQQNTKKSDDDFAHRSHELQTQFDEIELDVTLENNSSQNVENDQTKSESSETRTEETSNDYHETADTILTTQHTMIEALHPKFGKYDSTAIDESGKDNCDDQVRDATTEHFITTERSRKQIDGENYDNLVETKQDGEKKTALTESEDVDKECGTSSDRIAENILSTHDKMTEILQTDFQNDEFKVQNEITLCVDGSNGDDKPDGTESETTAQERCNTTNKVTKKDVDNLTEIQIDKEEVDNKFRRKDNDEVTHDAAKGKDSMREESSSETLHIKPNSKVDMDQLLRKPEVASLKSDQRPNRRAEKQISSPKLVFPEVPEGEDFHIQELGLSEGIFVFSYLSSFLSWIQPYDFPVELLRDALWSRVSIVDLITQSLQVEVGFIVCLTVGVLLALGVPCILIVHACCRLLDSKRNSNWNEDSASEMTNNCAVNLRRCTLVFVVQIILLLLVAGVVSMFVTNEQMSRAVEQTPSVVHTALNDVTTFLRNSHQQLRFVITKSLDQAVDATTADLDNVEELLGRPIQDQLAEETGVDVALDALVDVSSEARVISGRVDDLLSLCTETRELIVESREQLADLRMQVDMMRQQCPTRFRPLCNTVNASGLDVILRLETLMSDDRLVQIRGLRVGNLSLVTQQARGEFQLIPLRVEKDTRDARNGVKRQMNRQKDVLYESIWSLEAVTRDLTYKVENARSQALQIVRGVSTIEQWRWLTGLGSALCVLLIWLLLLSGISCGCCGVEDRAVPTLLASVVLMCIFSIALWAVALCALLVGGHGEVFVCRPLYDEPGYSALTRLVDRPGVLFQHGGGFFSNLLYGNSTMDVPLRDVLQKCQENGSTYSAFKLKQVFDVDSASNHRRWDMLHFELSHLEVNLSDFVLLTPELQQQLQNLLQASTANLSNYRSQMAGQVTGKDLQSFADQMSSIANQITDWSTLNRLENLVSTTRNLMNSHIQPLEQRKEDIVYQLTALEMQMSPLQRQVNQTLSHLKIIQYFINNQGGNISSQKSQDYTRRLIGYMDQYRSHVLNKTQNHVAPCRPVWNLYHAMRLLFCRHVMDPLNGFWFATVCCLLLFLAATPPCLKLIDHYKHLKQNSGLLHSRSSESPSETLMISEQGAPWSTPG